MTTGDLPKGCASVSIATPELGQVVRVRERHYAVTDVVPSSVLPKLGDGLTGEDQHLVVLSCVEDDRFADPTSRAA